MKQRLLTDGAVSRWVVQWQVTTGCSSWQIMWPPTSKEAKTDAMCL